MPETGRKPYAELEMIMKQLIGALALIGGLLLFPQSKPAEDVKAPEWECVHEAEITSSIVELRDRGVPTKRAEQSLAKQEENFARINVLPPLCTSCVAQQVEIVYSAPGRRCSAAMPRLAWYECRSRRRPFYPWETGRAYGPSCRRSQATCWGYRLCVGRSGRFILGRRANLYATRGFAFSPGRRRVGASILIHTQGRGHLVADFYSSFLRAYPKFAVGSLSIARCTAENSDF
jgi:hypothetical protein